MPDAVHVAIAPDGTGHGAQPNVQPTAGSFGNCATHVAPHAW
jgi:hypothetical protein